MQPTAPTPVARSSRWTILSRSPTPPSAATRARALAVPSWSTPTREIRAAKGRGPPVSFDLYNTIIANNGANECFFVNSMSVKGAGNLIMNNGSGANCQSGLSILVRAWSRQATRNCSLCSRSPGKTPTMAILNGSPAADMADSGTSLSTDQRGVARPQASGFDIGAYEARPPNFSFRQFDPFRPILAGPFPQQSR